MHERLFNRRDRAGEGAIEIGRKTAFGNPHRISLERATHEERVRAVQAYVYDLLANPALVEQIRRELAGAELWCYCSPRLCHGDVVARVADGYAPDAALADALADYGH